MTPQPKKKETDNKEEAAAEPKRFVITLRCGIELFIVAHSVSDALDQAFDQLTIDDISRHSYH